MDTIRMALECCVYPDRVKPNCERCRYSCTKAEWVKIDRKLAIDILAMLKAQEAKPPVVKENSYGWKFYYCPSCGKEFYQNNKFSFCENCGQAVKWG